MISAFLARLRGVPLLAALIVLAAWPAFATQYWELAPGKDPRVPVGTYTVVAGKTSTDGVNFTLKNNSLDNPIQLTVVSTTPGAALHLSVFKDEGSFLDQDSDAKGTIVVRFRTGDDIHFNVKGPAGAGYQLALWRGPAITLPQPDSVTPMDQAQSGAIPLPKQTAAAQPSAPAAMAAPATAPASHSNTLIYILLGGILVVLIAIAAILYRGQMRGKQ